MVIVVNGKEAVLKKNTSFEFVMENRDFTGADTYSLTITFPLRGCPQNLAIFGHINRKDCDIQSLLMDCQIHDGGFHAYGSISIVEISDTEVKTQYLEGRSESNFFTTFDEIYINQLDLGQFTAQSSSTEPAQLIKSIDNGGSVLCLPWVNNTSGNIQNCMKWDDTNKKFVWSLGTRSKVLSYQPYLVWLLERIFSAIGYTCDLSSLKKSQYRHLVVFNSLPGAWNDLSVAHILPHWTMAEFIEQLEYFLCAEFDIDHQNKKVVFSFKYEIDNQLSHDGLSEEDASKGWSAVVTGNENTGTKSEPTGEDKNNGWDWVVDTDGGGSSGGASGGSGSGGDSSDTSAKSYEVVISKVIDSFTVEVSEDADSADNTYLGASNLQYADNGNTAWKYMSCQWFINKYGRKAKVYDTMDELIEVAEGLLTTGTKTTVMGAGSRTEYWVGYPGDSAGNYLFYVRELETYFVMYCYKTEFLKEFDNFGGREDSSSSSKYYLYYNRLLPVNQFGDRFVSEDANTIEIKITPVCIMETDDTYGYLPFLECGEMSDVVIVSSSDDPGEGGTGNLGVSNPQTYTDNSECVQGVASAVIANGEEDTSSAYYDNIFMGFWDGKLRGMPKLPHPIVDCIEVYDDLSYLVTDYSLRLKGSSADEIRNIYRNIEADRKYKFSFLADTIPSVRATFNIQGKKYLCEKLTATFSDKGKSRLLKGEFYRIKS